MTKELARRMDKEAEQRRNAISLFRVALQVAGVPLKSMEVIETGTDDRYVKCVFNDGTEKLADITADSAPLAIWDVLHQVSRLQEQE